MTSIRVDHLQGSTNTPLRVGDTNAGSALCHLAPGATSVNAAPCKLTSGANLGTAETGAVEYDGSNLYFTPGVTRKTLAFIDSNLTGTASAIIQKDGSTIGTRPTLNFIEGSGVTITGVDESGNNRVNVQFTATASASAAGSQLVYGDGSDGTVTLSSNTTLTRNMYYDTLTVNAGVTADTQGFRIFCRTAAIINGFVHNNGLNATGSAGASGAGPAAPNIGGQVGGGNGNTGAGTGGGPANNIVGGSGGAGGAGSSGAGGAAGAATPPSEANGGTGVPRAYPYLERGNSRQGGFYGAGAGGGGGGGDGTNSGGGGGGAGSHLFLVAPSITGSGYLQANGGNGANGQGGNTGGGGGGGGGCLTVVSDTAISGVTLQANGGSGGTGSGTGANGTAGSAGRVYQLLNT